MRDLLKGTLFAILGAFVLLIVFGRFLPDSEDHTGVRRCFSDWNGSHPRLVEAVRSSLHDPSSFQHVRTVLAGQEGSDRRAVIMTYRAHNLLGGTVESRASAMIFPPTCHIEINLLEY